MSEVKLEIRDSVFSAISSSTSHISPAGVFAGDEFITYVVTVTSTFLLDKPCAV